ncbi:hypothetical protein, partial [Gordonia paraffinivorans]|uniref:hypothetical protein n=1 Tax=Gordonia paraffinivorans TaxID=175628 RepID=UPI003FCCAC93
SKHFYNHLRCAAGLIWLAEALGEEVEVLNSGVEAVRNAGRNPSSQCAAFRRVVPWSRILDLVDRQPEYILRGQAKPQGLRARVTDLERSVHLRRRDQT